MTNVLRTSGDLWVAMEQVLRDKGASDQWIEYALPELHQLTVAYCDPVMARGHALARSGEPLPNPQGNHRIPMNVVTEPDGSRWLELLQKGITDEMLDVWNMRTVEIRREKETIADHLAATGNGGVIPGQGLIPDDDDGLTLGQALARHGTGGDTYD